MKLDESRVVTSRTVVLLILLSIYVYLLVVTAWICDDAYITLRTVDNFVNGHGPRWNILDRVQAFTHPLWMLLLSFCYFFTREAYFTSISLSIAISIAAVAILAIKGARKLYTAVLLLLALMFSRAFVDYSTSGLENPLTHLLLIIYFLILLRGRFYSRTILFLSVITALGMLTRMDTAAIFSPGLAYALWKVDEKKLGVKLLFAGFLSFFMWEFYSLLYYGFLFPNTAYAKLNSGIQSDDLVVQGLRYMKNSLLNDPVTLTTVVTTLVIISVRRKGTECAAGAGIVLYLLYVVFIGGDFMSGRFLTAPFFVSLVIAGHIMENTEFSVCIRHMIPVGIVALGGVLCPQPPLLSGLDYGSNRNGLIDVNGIADERAWYYQFTGLLKYFQGIDMPNFPYSDSPRPGIPAGWHGLQARNFAETTGRWVFFESSIGIFGFFAGSRAHIVDWYALVDPYLARMPMKKGPWRIGHIQRVIPEGYMETLAGGVNAIRNPRLAAYYDKITIITRGDLTSKERLITIIEMNLHKYDDLLDGAS